MESFELDEGRFRNLIREVEEQSGFSAARAEASDAVFDYELFVVALNDAPELHEAGDAELLAWLVYALAQRQECKKSPPDFAGKGVLGHAASGPVAGDDLLLQVCVDGGIPVVAGPFDPSFYLGEAPRTQQEADDQMVRALQQLLEEATKVIPAARAAARD